MKRSKNIVLDKIEDARMTLKPVGIETKDANKLTENEYKKDIETRLNKRKVEIETIFDMVCKGIPTEDVGRKLGVAEGYIIDMVKRGREGDLEYWRKMYGV